MRAKVFSVMPTVSMAGSGHKLKHMKLCLNIICFVVVVVVIIIIIIIIISRVTEP